MNQTRAAFLLKLLLWVFYIIGSALNLIFLFPLWQESGLDIWTLAYVPMDLIYLFGGLYVALNFDSVLAHQRITLIKAFISLFIIDSLFNTAASLSVMYEVNSSGAPMTTGEIASGFAMGLGISMLVTFAIIRLIDIAAGVHSKKPTIWLTVVGWFSVALIVSGLIFFWFLSFVSVV